MRNLLHVVAAACLIFASLITPAHAELTLPPDAMEYATKGINGVYSLDFDAAQENIQKVFALYPDHPFAHFGNAMIAWSRYEYEFETSDDQQLSIALETALSLS